MNRAKKILFAVLIGCIVIQFLQPARNETGRVPQTDLEGVYNVPPKVRDLLQNACYDCHSDNTSYPWYGYIQPIGWILARDIENGKSKLNLSEFGSLSARRQSSRLRGIANQLMEGTMPLRAYQFMHPRSRLTEEERRLIIEWARATTDSLALRKK